MSISTLLNRYALSARAQGLSEKTITHTISILTYFSDYLGGISDVTQIGADDLRRFIVACRQKKKFANRPEINNAGNLSPVSVNTYVRAIRAFFGWLEREAIIKKNPMSSVPAPKLPKRLPKTLSEDQIKRLLREAACNIRNHAMVQLFLDSDMRLAELAGLKLQDIDLQNKVVTVIGKGDKQRHTFISADTANNIGRYIMASRPRPVNGDYLFLTETGQPLKPARIQKILEILGKRAGIGQHLGPHRLRHSYATLSLKYGANLEYLRQSLGHTDSQTTEIYLSVADSDVQKAHESFSPITHLKVTGSGISGAGLEMKVSQIKRELIEMRHEISKGAQLHRVKVMASQLRQMPQKIQEMSRLGINVKDHVAEVRRITSELEELTTYLSK